jgi:hypothetical protein
MEPGFILSTSVATTSSNIKISAGQKELDVRHFRAAPAARADQAEVYAFAADRNLQKTTILTVTHAAV